LQFLIGVLTFASKVVRPGRAFVRRLIEACKSAPPDNSRVPLSLDALADLRFWSLLAREWDGVSPILQEEWLFNPDSCCTSDASLLGFGVLCGRDWISCPWNADIRDQGRVLASRDMPYLELFVLVSDAATFSHRWRGSKITFLTDCASLVPIANSLSCRD